MHTTRYEAPTSIADAVRLMTADPSASPMAGGTDLLVQVRSGMKRPATVIDIKRIPELGALIVGDRELTIGAAVPALDICAHQEISRVWPGLVDAVHLIGSSQIQGRGSIGGNLCNASPAADATCALIANRAELVIVGPGGERRVAAERFCTGPGKTVLGPGELLVTIRIPRPAPLTSDAYLRLIPRTEMDIAVVGAAASITLDAKGVCTAARIAIGAVAPTALVVEDAANALVGSRLDQSALAVAAAAASAAARPIDDKRGTAAYRRTVVGVLVRRAATIAAGRVKGQ